jgi:hypothetical protein
MQQTTKQYETPIFSAIKSYSVEEILAAGGTSAFAAKMGKSPEKTMNLLQNLEIDSYLTNDELDAALEILNTEK